MIKCIAIDDEPLALRQIASYIGKTPYLELVEQFDNAIPAIAFIHENEVDLMFVDINMPDLNGMDFVKSLKNPPKVIFTTAYEEYAVESYKVDAIDYLLKPINYRSFLQSSEKAKSRLTSNEININNKQDFLFIKSEYKTVRVNLSDIKYIEGMREYVKIHFESQKPIMSLISMKKIASALSDNSFLRVHRSYIISLDKILAVERNRVIFEKDIFIPVSEQYKEEFQKFLSNNFLL